MRPRSGGPSGGASADLRLVKRSKRWPSAAGGAEAASAGLANATPPSTTDASDCVSSVKPLAVTAKSTPLAFQNRLCGVTSRSFGAVTTT